jgi:SagB-type dehydrogenase family enzyme
LYPAPGAAPDAYRPAIEGRPFAPATAGPLSAGLVGDVLRHSLGLSAWKVFGSSRWSLRVNPSSGNLHPTEAYIVCGPLRGVSERPAIYHYAADRHALEERCAFDSEAWSTACDTQPIVLVALASIHWRESWKYGERAFRYCQHDLGHAIAAVSLAAAMVGWRAHLLPSWSHDAIGTLIGSDRDEDFAEAEREDPGCLLVLTAEQVPRAIAEGPGALLRAVRNGIWTGRASQLSEDHVQWTFIDDIARATRDPGRPVSDTSAQPAVSVLPALPALPALPGLPALPALPAHFGAPDARALVLQRRSAVAFDGITRLDAATFFKMLTRVAGNDGPPGNALWWTPRIHLLLFVHRVNDVSPGIYLLGRERDGFHRLRQSIGDQLLREPAHDSLPLICLARGDCRAAARRLSCDQDIAADGFFSLGMIADFDASLAEYGPSFYRHLFWECGAVGQMLYLDAEAAGARATGIGCFYDDPVHDLLGLEGHAFQSLYHFTIGHPIEDRRLTTEPGYRWEQGA